MVELHARFSSEVVFGGALWKVGRAQVTFVEGPKTNVETCLLPSKECQIFMLSPSVFEASTIVLVDFEE